MNIQLLQAGDNISVTFLKHKFYLKALLAADSPDLLHQLPAALAPGGVIIVEQHLQLEAVELTRETEVIGPAIQNFRVAPGALQTALSELETVYSFEGMTPSTRTGSADDQRVAVLAQLVARKPL